MQNRIKELRKHLNLNQTEFGEKIGVRQTTIAGYESGGRTPLDTVIASICKEFNVNERWLRFGEGDMLRKVSKSDELSAFFGDLLRDEPDFRHHFIAMLSRMSVEEWKLLEKKALELAESIKKADP